MGAAQSGGEQRVEALEPLCVWKGRFLKSKIRRRWQSRLFFLCFNKYNLDVFFAYFSDQGIARYFIDLSKGFVTHHPAQKMFIVSCLGEGMTGSDDEEESEQRTQAATEDNFEDGEAQVWLLKYEEGELLPALFCWLHWSLYWQREC